MTFARWTFGVAGVYGLLVLLPGFFAPTATGGAINGADPVFYYGFLGSAIVWQLVFFLVASHPVRYRALMPIAVLEKLAFFATCLVLLQLGRMTPTPVFWGGMIDGALMVAFLLAWRLTPSPARSQSAQVRPTSE